MRSRESSSRQFYPPDGATENLEGFTAALKAAIEEENQQKVMEYGPGVAELLQANQSAQGPSGSQALPTAQDPLASLTPLIGGM